MMAAVPEAVAPATQVLTEFRLAAKHRGEACPLGLEFRLTAKRRPLELVVWDRKLSQ